MSDPIYCHVWIKGADDPIALTQDEWLKNNASLYHRVGGPAVIWSDGVRQWWQNGKPHRLDGPAIEWQRGFNEWVIDGIIIPGNEIEAGIIENDVDLNTEEGQMALKLRWA